MEHCPSGQFFANAAWLACGVLAHNLLRWTARLGDLQPDDRLTVARTVRSQLLAVPGRLVNRAGRLVLRVPERWPWAHTFTTALSRLRALPAAVTLLVGIPGVSYRSAQVILAEIGTDMSRFPTPQHLASWAGMCPGNNESAGKHRSGRTRHGSNWLRIALVEAAQAAGRSKDTYLSAQYARVRGRRGPGRAAVAVGHSILVIAWHLLSTGEIYTDLGGDYFDRLPHQHRPSAPSRRSTRGHGPQGHPRARRSLTPDTAFGAPRRKGAAAPAPLRASRLASSGDSHLRDRAGVAVDGATRVICSKMGRSVFRRPRDRSWSIGKLPSAAPNPPPAHSRWCEGGRGPRRRCHTGQRPQAGHSFP